MTDSAARDIPNEQLDALIVEMCDSLGQLPTAEFRARNRVQGQDEPIALVQIVWALCAHTHQVSRGALTSLSNGDLLSAAPLARMAFESAVTAQWMIRVPSGMAGFVHERLRQQRLLADEVLKTTWGSDMESAAQAAGLTTSEVPSVTSRQFEQICKDLQPGGSDAYVHYRWLSHFCHTSGAVVDSYTTQTDDRVVFRTEPSPVHAQENAHFCRYLIACSNVWAAAALDWVDYQHTRRARIKAAAGCLRITTEFGLSNDAWVRETTAARARRRAARDSRNQPRLEERGSGR